MSCISKELYFTVYFTVLLAQNYEKRIKRTVIKLFNKKIDAIWNEKKP